MANECNLGQLFAQLNSCEFPGSALMAINVAGHPVVVRAASFIMAAILVAIIWRHARSLLDRLAVFLEILLIQFQ
jgi:hypothetical protein